MIEVDGPSSKTYVLDPGVIDDRATLAFVGGQCHGLALAIHRRTGWPLAAVYKPDGECVHVCVRRPDGQLVDISGAHAEEDLATRESVRYVVRDIDESQILDLVSSDGWAVPASAAESWVDVVLDRAASNSSLTPMCKSQMRLVEDVEDLQVRFTWEGDPYMRVEVRRRRGPLEAWVLYADVEFPPDAVTGRYVIDFSAERFEGLVSAWLRRQFRRQKAEQNLRGA